MPLPRLGPPLALPSLLVPRRLLQRWDLDRDLARHLDRERLQDRERRRALELCRDLDRRRDDERRRDVDWQRRDLDPERAMT